MFCFVFIILGRCSNKYFCIFWYRLFIFKKNAKHNIFVNHTNLLYSVQIKMIFFFGQKQYRFCFFLQETRSNNFGEWISYLDLKACFFFLYTSWYRCLVGQCGLGSLCLTLSLIYIVYIFCVILRHQIL